MKITIPAIAEITFFFLDYLENCLFYSFNVEKTLIFECTFIKTSVLARKLALLTNYLCFVAHILCKIQLSHLF